MTLKFKTISTPIEGVIMIEPTVFGDHRGFFMETYSERDFVEIGLAEHFVQDNHSKSHRGVLRGLHFQRRNTQGKLIRVVAGSVWDVAVDLRAESATFGHYFATVLSAENKRQMYIPERFGHGFLTLEDDTEVLYKCTHYYDPESDAGVLWNDPEIAIQWPLAEYGIPEPSLSEKDKNQPQINQIDFKTIWE